jgi:hypothetical protein
VKYFANSLFWAKEIKTLLLGHAHWAKLSQIGPSKPACAPTLSLCDFLPPYNSSPIFDNFFLFS